mmetsp:Transcript_32122/g.50126  ORF Transcript_32122/g.50126 Transcript_32122/m.50126 type:complete len:81 (-) Transcript_32122:1311-1553(-)
MYYNKVAESMQQGKARSNTISDKFSRLLSPSTSGLQSIVLDETCSQTNAKVRQFRPMLGGNLVSCSIQNHPKPQTVQGIT